MAASTVAGGIFNAFAFAGASWIFSHVDHGNYQAEQRRHDLAIEKMQQDQELWTRKETEMRDRIAVQRLQTEQADHDLKEGVDALDQYHKLLKEYDTIKTYKDNVTGDLSHYYTPSPEFKKYLVGFKIVIIGGGIYIVSKYIW